MTTVEPHEVRELAVKQVDDQTADVLRERVHDGDLEVEFLVTTDGSLRDVWLTEIGSQYVEIGSQVRAVKWRYELLRGRVRALSSDVPEVTAGLPVSDDTAPYKDNWQRLGEDLRNNYAVF